MEFVRGISNEVQDLINKAGLPSVECSLLACEDIKREEELVYNACKNFKRYMIDVFPQGDSFPLYETLEMRSKLYQFYLLYLI